MEKSLMIVTEAFELGGVETYIRSEVEGLIRQGWRVHLVCGRRFSREMLPQGLASLTSDLVLGPEAGIEEFLGSVDQIVSIARSERISFINAHPFTALIPALASASILRVPCIATLHGPSSVAGSYGPAYDFMLASLVLPAASRVLSVSGEVATLVAPYVEPERLQILPNPIDVPDPSPSSAPVERLDRWLIVSRLDSAKSEGVISFVRSAAAIGLPGVDLCGDGPERERIEDLLRDLLDNGWLRLLGPHPAAVSLMPSYQGVAGMGRVALEGIAAGLPVILVGYDGIKGLLEDELYARAVQTNLSGRGLPSISSAELQEQLRVRTAESTAAIAGRVLAERGAEKVWSQFEAELMRSEPVRSVVLDVYLQQLRAMHATSHASAYWSREVMEAMARVVASPLAVGTPLLQAFSVYSQAFTRSIVEQQGSATRDSFSHQPPPVIEVVADPALSNSVQEGLVRLEQRLEAAAAGVGASNQSLRSTLESEMQRALDILRPDVESLNDQLQEVAGRITSDQRHEASRIRDALQTQSAHVASGITERFNAEIEMLRRFHLQAGNEARSELSKEFEQLRDQARLESQKHTELVQKEMSAFRDIVRQQTITSAGEFRRDSRLAFTEAIRGFEIKMERAIEGMESTLRQDIANVAGGMDVHAAMNRDITELNERISALEQELVEVYSSSSWVLTRPIRVLKRLILQPRATWRLINNAIATDQGAESGNRATRSSKLSRAWNFMRRSIRTGRIDPADKARLLSMIRSNYTNVAASLGVEVQRPSLAPVELEDVFVWSVIDWHFRMQRPQHLAAAMAAKGHRVFYISNNFVDSTTAGFTVEALDQEGRLFQVNLNVAGAPQIYFDVANADQVSAIQASLAKLLQWTSTVSSISLVQHPFWLEPAQSLPDMRLVYDCMDHHGGFEDNAANVIAGERILVERSDLLIVTSQWLQDEMEGKSQNIAMIRNATEYEHFCERPDKVFADEAGRQVIGYYGAIAEWFDVELIRQVAVDHPHALVLLVGRDTANAEERLAGVANVRFVGEVPYKDLPYWLHGFDVCLLPFRVIPLTLATNPVKVYEYLSAGKPTVSVDLPELSQFEGLVRLATAPADFSREVTAALQPEWNTAEHIDARKSFARRQTWAHRAADLDKALATINEPKVSVVVLCYNNIEFTQACLHSIDLYSDYPNLEIIAVDNASSDGTPEYLREWAAAADNRVFIRNDSNLGFSAGNNVGLRAATGEYLVILNNDTYVTPGWVRGLSRHLKRNPDTGIIGPVTNNIGNEARIEIHYADMEEMVLRAGEYTRRHAGISFEMSAAAFFCVMLTRRAYETVGPMDEDFGVGFFEDDDYCRRLSLAGFEVRCADDVFVHHHLSASFNKLKAEAKQALFETNRAIYERKWGPWVPHVYRDRTPL